MKPCLPAFLLICLSFAAPAQQSPAPAERLARMFTQLDANRDGKLSKEELPERMRPNFERLDTDKDGFISKAEHLAVAAGRASTGRPQQGPRPVPAGVEARLDLPYAENENPRQKLDLYLPKERKADKPLPVIVFIHGGGWRNGDKAGGIGNLGRFVASGDYAGVSVGYRLTGEAQWPAQIHDCKAAIRWIKAHAEEHGLDATKIGVWGTSAGGHLVSMLGTSGDVKELEGTLGKHLDQDSQVTCVANYYGPENFITMVRQPSTIDRSQGRDYPEALLLGGPVPEREAVAREASPVTHVSAGDAAFFTAHGTKDPVVPYAQGEEIHAALTKAGVPSILQEMTNGGHGFRSEELDGRLKQFFDLHLRGVESQIETEPIVVTESRK
ncbi:alpha/beta hydrolase fold domain-containing protein [Prosthecobacter sp. SYSU 5D2]|uniref:alpha/beta hydrolase fold domain-containing protein n=1 Tax=Prosthecobacter sp. SYSU 5D2 TaxID=3134134 RepID=UPI0031FE4F32